MTVWQEMIDFTKKRDQTTEDEFWICEHPPVFTLGTSLKNNTFPIRGIPCIHTDRGGKITYHGPGQLVGYPLLDLRKNHLYPKELLNLINQTVLSVMREFGVEGVLGSPELRGYTFLNRAVPVNFKTWLRFVQSALKSPAIAPIMVLRSTSVQILNPFLTSTHAVMKD